MENIRLTLEHPPAAVVVVVVGSGGGGSVDERLITCRHQVHLGQWKGVQHGRNLGICPHQQSRPNDQFKTEWLLKFPHSFGNFELPHVIRLTLMKGKVLGRAVNDFRVPYPEEIVFFCYRFVLVCS